MVEKNRKKLEQKERHLKEGTFIGCRPSRQEPKKGGAYDRKAFKGKGRSRGDN